MLIETIKRFLAPTPIYFKKLAVLCISLASASAIALKFWNELGLGEMPDYMFTALHACGVAGTVGTFISFLTIQDKSQIK